MACLNGDLDTHKKLLTHSVRNEIVRDLVTQMYCVNPRPDKHLCTLVAKKLVAKYKCLADIDKSGRAIGYVSYCCCCC